MFWVFFLAVHLQGSTKIAFNLNRGKKTSDILLRNQLMLVVALCYVVMEHCPKKVVLSWFYYFFSCKSCW